MLDEIRIRGQLDYPVRVHISLNNCRSAGREGCGVHTNNEGIRAQVKRQAFDGRDDGACFEFVEVRPEKIKNLIVYQGSFAEKERATKDAVEKTTVRSRVRWTRLSQNGPGRCRWDVGCEIAADAWFRTRAVADGIVSTHERQDCGWHKLGFKRCSF